MKCTVYRSLDKPDAFFGMRGRFKMWFAAIAAFVVLFGFIVGGMTDSLVGVIFVIAGTALDYVFVLSLQGKSSEREFAIRMQAQKVSRFIRVPAMAFRHLWRGDR